MAIAEKLTKLNNIKLAIKDELADVGMNMEGSSFEQYPSVINEKLKQLISGETGAIRIPRGVTNINHYLFYMSTVHDVILPDTVKWIGFNAFENCYNLTKLDMTNLEEIGGSAFNNCTGLKSIVLGTNLKSIGNLAFAYCAKLTDVYYRGSKTEWNNIIIGQGNEVLTESATIHYNYTG